MTHTEDTELPTHLLRLYSWREELRAARNAGDERRASRALIWLSRHHLWLLRYIGDIPNVSL